MGFKGIVSRGAIRYVCAGEKAWVIGTTGTEQVWETEVTACLARGENSDLEKMVTRKKA